MSVSLPGIAARILPALGVLLAVALLLLSFATVQPAYADQADLQNQATAEQRADAFADADEDEQANQELASEPESSLSESTAESAGPGLLKAADKKTSTTEDSFASTVHGFAWVLLAVIVAVAVFFVVSIVRLNKNISQMRHFVD